MEKLLVKAKGGPMTLHSGFRSFANDRNGTISQSGFARALEHYGVVLRPEELSVRVPPHTFLRSALPFSSAKTVHT
jgi:hypothetical protein